MKSIKIIILFILSIALNTSCKKFLDKKSSSRLDVPKDLNDLQALLDNANIMNVGRTPSFGEGSSDDYFLLQATFDAREPNDQDLYRWIPFDYNWENDWSRCYNPIYNSNYCLEILEDITRTNSNMQLYDNVKGSALFYRAYYFLQLVWTFSKAYDESVSNSELGIVLRLSSDFNIPSVRASVEESYDQLLEDAKESILYLPDHPQHTYRPSRASAYGLLARAYISMRQYDSAFKYSNLCLSIKNGLIDFEASVNVNSSVPFQKFNAETIFYSEMNTFAGTVRTSRALVDTSLFSLYANNDLRRRAFFQSSGVYRRFKGSYAGSSSILFTGLATDEIYLIRAECYARAANKDDALTDLNTLLEKRYDSTFVPISSVDANETLNAILLERRKELYWRGLRFIDIKRLNKEGANIVQTRIINGQMYTLSPNDNKYAIALPKDIIEQSGIAQNPQ